ncbi:hypothetical protein A2U01_0118913, partial [Trifolium medium]|nr:hypothetical protein [Trifolium medium]
FLGGLEPKPPKNTLLCVLVAKGRQARIMMSPGEGWRRCRQLLPITGKLSDA